MVGDKELGSTRAQTAAVTALEEEDKPPLKRAGTMAQTAQVSLGAAGIALAPLCCRYYYCFAGGGGVSGSSEAG